MTSTTEQAETAQPEANAAAKATKRATPARVARTWRQEREGGEVRAISRTSSFRFFGSGGRPRLRDFQRQNI